MSGRDFSPFLQRFGWPRELARFPLCIGHRGASGHARENTLAAFELATRLGAEMWELDTQLSRDGIVIVSHDDHLERVFGVDCHVGEMTADEIDCLDPGPPTFAQVAALARRLGAGLYVELKARGTGPLCIAELERHDQRFACLGSFDQAQIVDLRDRACRFPLAVLVSDGHDPHTAADQTGADIVHLCWERAGERPQDLVTPDLTGRAMRAGREVVLWHEERPAVLKDLVALPVLAICTDLPELMRGVAA